MARIHCNQCEAAMINGVFCHEIGCPNSKKTWEAGEWVKYYECFECGCDVREGETCDCQCFDDDPDHDDTTHCCPDCERPNQFGELCAACARERGEQAYQ